MGKFRRSEIAIASSGLAIIVIWVVWLLFGVSLANWWLGPQPAPAIAAGTWGDSFGGFNALIGALGFLAVVATFLFQARTLRSQQEDQHRQRFESFFFQMLTLMREVRQEILFKYSDEYHAVRADSLTVKNTTKRGPEAMFRAGREARYWLDLEKKSKKSALTEADMARVYTKRIHTRYESRLSPYFRIVYTILRQIKDDPILPDDEKVRYGNLLRSQLQSHEVLLLALNGLTPIAKDLPDLITEFRLLKYLPSRMWRTALIGPYPEAAFESRD